MAFRGVIAPILFVGSAFAHRVSTDEDEGFPWHHTWCNPLSSLSEKDYKMEIDFEGQQLMLQLHRKSDSLTLRMVEGHWGVWRHQDNDNYLQRDLLYDAMVSPEPEHLDITVDLIRDVRYLRRVRFGNGLPGALEIQWINGQRAQFAGGVWYPPHETYDAAKSMLVVNGTGVIDKIMTRQLDGRDFEPIRMLGMPIQNISLAGEANKALVLGTLSNLVGVATEGANPALFPNHAWTLVTSLATWATQQHNIHYAASDKWFDKLWCHPLYKRCEAEGVIVPKDMTCPQEDVNGELLPPGYDGPSDFFFVAVRMGCNGGSTDQQHEQHFSSRDAIVQWFSADAMEHHGPDCFHLDTLPWNTTVGPQWYKLWCDTETGVSGMQSFPDSACDVSTGQYANIWQLSSRTCLHDEVLGVSARHYCVAAPATAPAPVEPQCGPLALDQNAACRDAVSLAYSEGKHESWAGDAYSNMMSIAGVTHSAASLGDFHRLFFCDVVERMAQCASPPCDCTNPPCNVCPSQ